MRQRAGLLLPDLVPFQGMGLRHYLNGYDGKTIQTAYQNNLIQDLAENTIMIEFDLDDLSPDQREFVKEMDGKDIYDSEKEDIAHTMIFNAFQMYYTFISETNLLPLSNMPMPGYNLQYYEVFNWLWEQKRKREKMTYSGMYYFEEDR